MKKITKMFVGVFCAMSLATAVFAADAVVKASTNAPVAIQTTSVSSTNDWVMSIGGSGATTTTGDSKTALGVNVALGRTFTLLLPGEVGIRQFYGYTATDATSIASTKVYADFTVLKFNLTKAVPVDVLIGVNGGPTYGNTPLVWAVGPEAGVNVWLAKNVALDARIEFPFVVSGDHGGAANVLSYVIGVKFKL